MEPLHHTSESIYNILKVEILNLTLSPGQAISEHEICTRFSVSRTPVRTAFQRLQTDGLLDVVPYKGSVVTLLDFDRISQTIYMRTAVESSVLKDFIEISTPMLEEKVRYQIRKQAVLIETDFDPALFYKMDATMHKIWFDSTNKQLLWQMMQSAEIHYTRFRMLDIVAVKNFKAIVREHEEILSAIQSRDSEKLSILTKNHLYGGINRLKERISGDLKDYFKQPAT